MLVPARPPAAGGAVDADARPAAGPVRTRRPRLPGALRELARGPPRDPRAVLLPQRRTAPGARVPGAGGPARRTARRAHPGSAAVAAGAEGGRTPGRRRRRGP